MVNNKIGCSAGKTSLIDPNNFSGTQFDNNTSVPLEDLNISVQLSTYKKGRTVLSAGSGGNNGQSSKTVKVNFIEGSVVNGVNVLTTKYTDLTTSFESGNDGGENIGITNIDIDFNSQQVPMVNISFVDVRGSAIFQNEDNILNGSNKFSTFFQLPYPMYELTVKGYYGQAVKYCLHMIKFNTKFNSQTGNFEITANFIGYTYAMLSDMILGFLKAIPYTTIGKDRYNLINTERQNAGKPPIIDLNELAIKIETITSEIAKISKDEKTAATIGASNRKNDILVSIKNEILILGQAIGVRQDTDSTDTSELPSEYKYIFTIINDNSLSINRLTTNVGKLIDEFNDGSKTTITKDVFDKIGDKLSIGVTNEELNDAIPLTTEKLQVLAGKLNVTPTLVTAKRTDIFKYSKRLGIISTINIYDLSTLYSELDRVKLNLTSETDDAKKEFAIVIKNSIRDKIGFEPTIRNIVEIFTTAVEVFMSTLYTVSIAAEGNPLRTEQLKQKFKPANSNDFKLKSDGDLVYFPWPDYREEDEANKQGFVEKYLGSYNVLNNPSNVNELEFIDNLLSAFLIADTKSQNALNALTLVEKLWLPINPVDTKLFVDNFPYKRLKDGGIDINAIAKTMVIRGMTFLGYSNAPNSLSDDDIIAMAGEEATSALRDIANTTVKGGLNGITLKDFVNAKGDIDGKSKLVLSLKDSEYYYEYISGSKDIKLLPITGNAENGLNNLNESDVFLTNYNNNTGKKGDIKKTDGGVYIKIFSDTEFNSTNTEFISSVTTTTQPIILSEIKKEPFDSAAAGFSLFGGKYGIQEFKDLTWSDSVGTTPLSLVFYKDSTTHPISSNRVTSKVDGTKYDLRTLDKKFYYDKTILFPSKKSIREYYYLNSGRNISLLKQNKLESNIAITYPFINYGYINQDFLNGKEEIFSLFGSTWYYSQSNSKYPEHSKAMLYLHTLPFRANSFEVNEIANLFNKRSGFIHAPKLWCAYIGSLLWRADTSELTNGGSGKVDPIVWGLKIGEETFSMAPTIDIDDVPKRNQYIKTLDENDNDNYSDQLTYLPEQVKDEFKRIFFDFVTGGSTKDWPSLKNRLEIWSGSGHSFLQELISLTGRIVNESNDNNYIKGSPFKNFKNVDKYEVITALADLDRKPYLKELFLELRGDYGTNYPNGDTNVIKDLIDGMTEEVIIANTGYGTWRYTGSGKAQISTGSSASVGGSGTGGYTSTGTVDTSVRRDIKVSTVEFNKYFNEIVRILTDKTNEISTSKILKDQENKLFGTSNDDIIKMQLYRHCKNVYDKWLGGAKDIDNLIFQCGDGARNSLDFSAATYNRNSDKPRLIDSFKFVTRSFKDIGDELFINPSPIGVSLSENPNSSVYTAITDLLGSNNFLFNALPTFINYKDENVLTSIFEPQQYGKAIENGVCGPSFVCVYVGQSSIHLDYNDSDYSNDSFDFKCDENRNLIGLPKDFSEDALAHENSVPVFGVNFGHQNQNIFKDITLDQSEFGETAESLKIVDNITKNGAENNKTLAGQNMYNVYSVRSYKAEVEMMGNAMIQPMMYFQLNNIPMFHGAYMITRVKHNIKPNTMSTTFSGVRVRFPETKLFDASDLYMSLIDSLDLSKSNGTKSSGGSTTGSFPPIVLTIRENGGDNGNIINGNITGTKIPNIKGISVLVSGESNILVSEAVPPLEEMLKEWVAWMIANEFKGINGVYAKINSAFRSNAEQVRLKKQLGATAAEPGSSNHGWGIAIDFQFIAKNGDVISNYSNGKPNTSVGYDLKRNESLVWLLENSYRFGWIIPETLRDDKGLEEFWHFEYHGTCAVTMLNEMPLIKGLLVKTNKTVSNLVKNPKTVKNVAAVYTSCKYQKIKGLDGGNDDGEGVKTITGDAPDFWALLAICSLEAGNKQGRVDVAQSIYNRLATPNKPYGKTIKGIIIEPKQYEPTFKNRGDWKRIKDLPTAIIAVSYSKGVSETTARIMLSDTKNALLDQNLISESKAFIGTRTEFLANDPTSSEAISVIQRTPENIHNAFYWRYAGVALRGKAAPNPPNWGGLNVDTKIS